MPPLALGVLDQSPDPVGLDAGGGTAQHDRPRAARRAARLQRYWLAEHHNTRGLAGPAPEVMVATVAAATSEIRVGSGGVMLPHYSSLKVAETFHVLEALHPGRIDLGIGRAPGGDQLSAAALRIPTARGRPLPAPGAGPDRLPRGPARPAPPVRAGAGDAASRAAASTPPVWLLGSSDYSAAVASVLGTGFSFAHFINPTPGPDVVAEYREQLPALPHARPSRARTWA